MGKVSVPRSLFYDLANDLRIAATLLTSCGVAPSSVRSKFGTLHVKVIDRLRPLWTLTSVRIEIDVPFLKSLRADFVKLTAMIHSCPNVETTDRRRMLGALAAGRKRLDNYLQTSLFDQPSKP